MKFLRMPVARAAGRWGRLPFLLIPAAILLIAAAAAVHTALLSSSPSDGATLTEAATTLSLTFSEDVPLRSTTLRLIDPDRSEVELILGESEGSNTEVVAALPPGLQTGSYLVEWATLGSDGHPVTGTLTFFLDLPAEQADTLPLGSQDSALTEFGDLDSQGGFGMDGEMEMADVEGDTGPTVPVVAAITRAFALGLLGALTGLLFFLIAGGWDEASDFDRLIRPLAIALPVAMTLHLLAWLWQIRREAPIPVMDLLLYITPGRIELARTLLVWVALALILAGRRYLAAASVLVLAVVVSGFTGHAMTFVPPLLVPSRAIHIAGLAVWLGGLLILLRTMEKGEPYRATAERVSTMALVAVIVMFVTGAIHVLAFPVPLVELATSFYGALLIAKLVAFAGLVALGARNRFSLMPMLPDEAAIRKLRTSVAWEVGLMAIVLLITGFIAYSALPETAATAEMAAVAADLR